MASEVSRWRLIAAYAAVYVLWGSSYLGIQIAIETLPPLFSAGLRYAVAGLAIMIWVRGRGMPMPNKAEWRIGLISGVLMFVVNSGGIVWATQFVASGMVALLNSTTALWMVLIDWLIYHSTRPNRMIFLGLLLGLIGMVMLSGPDQANPAGIYLPALLILIIAPGAWALGSLLIRRSRVTLDPIRTSAIQLTTGGLLLSLVGIFNGELVGFQWDTVSLRSVLAIVYLAIASSIIAYGSFVWLMRVDTPARVATYGFVNPVVALFLGVVLAGEPLTAQTMLAAAVILAGVIIITYHKYLRLPGRLRPAPQSVS
jgi:drug/metabolite transporter (DMT)-like permease